MAELICLALLLLTIVGGICWLSAKHNPDADLTDIEFYAKYPKKDPFPRV